MYVKRSGPRWRHHTAAAHHVQPPALTPHIVRRRAVVASLEAEMIAACETAALGRRSESNGPFDREDWDRATWHRYLAATMRLETVYGPRMRRLRQEIGQLERLMTLRAVA